jgi:16S rRNA (guanine1207-N2)-methyltransferase
MAHYFSEHQESAFRLAKVKYQINGIELEFYTAPGVFSPRRVDKGTDLLIQYAIISPGWKVLDFGSGYGVVGITIAKLHPKCQVTMTEINRRAVKLTLMNIKNNNITNADIRQGDLFAGITEKYNAILLNPPQSAGKKMCYDIIEKSIEFLEKGGMLQLVARHNIGGNELAKKMLSVFGNVKDTVKKGGYRIYVSEKE